MNDHSTSLCTTPTRGKDSRKYDCTVMKLGVTSCKVHVFRRHHQMLWDPRVASLAEFTMRSPSSFVEWLNSFLSIVKPVADLGGIPGCHGTDSLALFLLI